MSGRLVAAGLLVLGAMLASGAAPAHAQQPLRAPDEVELIQLERDWDRAFLQNDTVFIDRVLARRVRPPRGRWQCVASQSQKVPA